MTDVLMVEASKKDSTYRAPDFGELWARANRREPPSSARDHLRQWCAAEVARLHGSVVRLPYLTGHPDPLGGAIEAMVRLRPREQQPLEYVGDVYALAADRKTGSGPVVGYRELVTANRRVVLLGDPGMGKSWLLIRHAIDLLEAAGTLLMDPDTDPGTVPLPFFVRCDAMAVECRRREHSGETLTLPAVTMSVLAAQHRTSEFGEELWAWLEKYCQEGPAEYLIDALDETPAAERPALHRLLHQTGGSHDRIVVTCRHAGYSVGIFPATGRCEAELLAMTRVDDYIDTWDLPAQRRRELDQRLRHQAIAKMVQIPLLLVFLCHLAADPEGALPEIRSGLYGQILRRFLREEHRGEDRGVDDRLSADPIEREHELLAVLRPLAYAVAVSPEGWRDRISEAELQRHLLGIARPAGMTPAQVLRVVSVRTGILVPDGDVRDGRHPPYLFIHRTLMEYLVAEHIATTPELLGQCARTHLHLAANWREVWLLAAGIAPRSVLAHLVGCEIDSLHIALKLAADAVAELSPEQKTDLDDLIALIQDLATRLLRAPGANRNVRHLAAVALGRLGSRALPVLTDAMTQDDTVMASVDGLVAVGAPALPIFTGSIAPSKKLEFGARLVLFVERCSAIASMRDPEAIPGLVEALFHKNIEVSAHAADALGVIGSSAQAPALVKAWFTPRLLDEDGVNSVGRALRRLDPYYAIAEVVPRLDDTDPAIRKRAVEMLGALGHRGAVPVLTALFADPDTRIVYAALESLQPIASADAVPSLREIIEDTEGVGRHMKARRLAVDALGYIDDAAAIDVLERATDDPDSQVATHAVHRLSMHRIPASFAALIRLLDHPRNEVRAGAAEAVTYRVIDSDQKALAGRTLEAACLVARAYIDNDDAVGDLAQALQDRALRPWAAWGLVAIGSTLAFEKIRDAMSSRDLQLRLTVARALNGEGSRRVSSNRVVEGDPIAELRRHALESALADENLDVRFTAAVALAGAGVESAGPILIEALAEGADRHWLRAVQGLGYIGNPSSAPILFMEMGYPSGRSSIPRDAARALESIGTQAVLYAIDRSEFGPYSRKFMDQIVNMAFEYFADRTTTLDIRPAAILSLHRLTQLADGYSSEPDR
ncbi:HEAT repeat domain-containing protein [Nocardia sp. CA-128927]|uniref:HEAT repeat domain-containing protein n=1 Tax=Nocardia sp. CA-128927 TaxID=3239975 RepID=UPI003D988A89